MKKLLFTLFAMCIAAFGMAQNNPTSQTDTIVLNLTEYDGSFTGSIEANSWYPTSYVFTASLDGVNWDTLAGPVLLGSQPSSYSVSEALIGVFMPNTTYHAAFRSFTVTSTDTVYDVSHNVITFTTLDTPQVSIPQSIIQTGADLQYVFADYSWTGGNAPSDHEFQTATTLGNYVPAFTTTHWNSGTSPVVFGPFNFDVDTVYVRVRSQNPQPIPNSFWEEFILVKPTPVDPVITSVNVDANFGGPDSVRVIPTFDLGTSNAADLSIEIFDGNGNSVDVDNTVQNISGSYTADLSGYTYPGGDSAYAVIILTDQLTQGSDTVTVDFVSEGFIDPGVTNIVVNQNFGGPTDIEITTSFDLGDSPSGNLTVSLWDTDGILINTTGPMLQTASGTNVSILSGGYTYPGGIISYATAALVDPVTSGGDTLVSTNFLSPMFADLSVMASIDTGYGAIGEALITVEVVDTGDCAPATALWELYNANGLMVDFSTAPLVLDSIGQFTDIAETPSGDSCTVFITVTDNCGNVFPLTMGFTAQVVPELQVTNLVVDTAALGPDQVQGTVSVSLGLLDSAWVSLQTWDSTGTSVDMYGPVMVYSDTTLIMTINNLNPFQSGYTATAIAQFGTDIDMASVTFQAENVNPPTGVISSTVVETDCSFSFSVDVDPNGTFIQSETTTVCTVVDTNGFTVYQAVFGPTLVPATYLIEPDELESATYDVHVTFSNVGGDFVLNFPASLQSATYPDVAISSFVELPGNMIQVGFEYNGNGNNSELTWGLLVNGFSVSVLDSVLGPCFVSLTRTVGPFVDCDEVRQQVVTDCAAFGSSSAVQNLQQTITVNCPEPSSIEEGTVMDNIIMTSEWIEWGNVIGKLKVVSMSGQEVMVRSLNGNNERVALQSLSSGIYAITLVTEDQHVFSVKRMIQ